MHSNNRTTVFICTFIILLSCVPILYATRIPMEIVELTSTQVVTSDEKKLSRHKMTSISDVIISNNSGGAGDGQKHSNTDSEVDEDRTDNVKATHQKVIEQRKGRQIAETVHKPRILYQVGVSFI